MNIDSIIRNKHHYYRLAQKLYELCDKSDLGQIIPKTRNKSLALLIDSEFIPTPSIQITLELFDENTPLPLGRYIIYIDDKENFIDEFLIMD